MHLRPVPLLRVRMESPQVLLQHEDAEGSVLLAPRSVRLLVLGGPVNQASAVFLRDSRRPPPSLTGCGVTGYDGEDPARMEHEFHVRLRSVAAFMSPTAVDVTHASDAQACFLPQGHTREVGLRLQAAAAALFGGGAGPVADPPSSASGDQGSPSDEGGFKEHGMRCVLSNADLQVGGVAWRAACWSGRPCP